jgi:hypothetical protein
MIRRRTLRALIGSAVAALSMWAAAPASAGTETFDYTGSTQTWVVPANVTSATFDLYGAAGGSTQQGAGGLGGRATATLPVTPGATVRIEVGATGAAQDYTGSYNGGGPGVANGGGATDIRIGGGTLTDRVLVAGGGGAAGEGCNPPEATPNAGSGGGLTGGSSAPSCRGVPTPGGTQTEGGQNPGNGGASVGSPGVLGFGGGGLPSSPILPEALGSGGGGGGYYGGGGGFEGSGGGGGSGFGPAATVFENGVRAGNGLAQVTFADPQTLSVGTVGIGSGYVSSNPAGIDCETGSATHTSCSAIFTAGDSVTLTANPATGSDFTGWAGGGCAGSATTCTVTMDQARGVSAEFSPEYHSLNVTRDGTGSGAVTSSPIGIDCGSACSQAFQYNAQITLSAEAATGSDFTGWSGSGCSGTGDCVVAMTEARDVTATFTADDPPPPVDEPPVIDALQVIPRSFQAGDDATPVLRRKGTKIEIDVSEAARVQFRVKNRVPSGDGTAPPPPPDRPRAFRRELPAGESVVPFSGKLAERKFPPGRYRLVARAWDSAEQSSARVAARFRVIP